MNPSYEELLELVRQLREENKLLREKIAKLEERLNLNSQNSSKAQSSDQKRDKKAPRGGAKKGHKGHHRRLHPIKEVSTLIQVPLKRCIHCRCERLKQKGHQIFQQIELPVMKPHITQFELEKGYCCMCGKKQVSALPSGYAHSSFGPKLVSFIAACSSVYRMSKRTTQTLLKSLCNIKISLGSIPVLERRLSTFLAPVYASLTDKIDKSKVAYVDETSFRQCAQTHYVWTATTQEAALIRILRRRNLESLNQIRPRGHSGITVSDRYGVYAYKRHQYCLAHIKRDFKKFSARAGPDGEIASRALFELNEIFKASHLCCRKSLQRQVYYRKKRLEDILCDAFANGSERFARFADRLLDHFSKLFLFTRYEGVECTSNAAERTLRHIVLWRKTSYGTQSDEGSRFLERAVSIWMTLKKQGREVLPFFEQAYRATLHSNLQTPLITPS